MNLLVSQLVREKIETDFDSSVQDKIAEMLSRYTGNEQERVQLDILRLVNGNEKEISSLIEEARLDYRNIIYWAEYPKEARETNHK